MVDTCLFRGAEACILRNDRLAVVVLKIGGKIASIRKDDREYLYQGRSEEFIPPQFEGDFGKFDLSGFDDMVPTINAGFIQDGVFAGVHMADHGEVWALGWNLEAGSDAIRADVDGVRLPYHFSKELKLHDNVLSVEYRLCNKSEFAFPCLWAAHMLINAGEDTRIIPAECGGLVRSTLDMSSRLKGFGALHSWPETRDRNGCAYHLDRLAPRDAGVCEKYYFEGPLRNGEIGIMNPGMTIRFDPKTIPYLGIWLNSKGYKDQYNIGIEPSTAPLDSPENARQWGYPALLEGHGEIRWRLEIEINPVDPVAAGAEK
ncbi:MAG: hypothetical protein LBO80_00815 [Treponema sp.]|jgi:hypothetical protein|nr:hypothetical protein [Treponema sp.]